jgi:hypothetical protein
MGMKESDGAQTAGGILKLAPFKTFKSVNRCAPFKSFQKNRQQKPSQQDGPSQGIEVYCPWKSGRLIPWLGERAGL